MSHPTQRCVFRIETDYSWSVTSWSSSSAFSLVEASVGWMLDGPEWAGAGSWGMIETCMLQITCAHIYRRKQRGTDARTTEQK